MEEPIVLILSENCEALKSWKLTLIRLKGPSLQLLQLSVLSTVNTSNYKNLRLIFFFVFPSIESEFGSQFRFRCRRTISRLEKYLHKVYSFCTWFLGCLWDSHCLNEDGELICHPLVSSSIYIRQSSKSFVHLQPTQTTHKRKKNLMLSISIVLIAHTNAWICPQHSWFLFVCLFIHHDHRAPICHT